MIKNDRVLQKPFIHYFLIYIHIKFEYTVRHILTYSVLCFNEVKSSNQFVLKEKLDEKETKLRNWQFYRGNIILCKFKKKKKYIYILDIF